MIVEKKRVEITDTNVLNIVGGVVRSVTSPTEMSNFNKSLLRATEISIIFQQRSENVKK